jgi:hypothetical protein
MPTLTEAYGFIDDPNATVAQLRVACEIIGLDPSGSPEELRDRLHQYLADFGPGAEVVCLRPEPDTPSAHPEQVTGT